MLNRFSFGGASLALKNGSSQSVGSADVLAVLVAFEEVNNCKLVVTIQSLNTLKLGILELEVRALSRSAVPAEPVLLGCQKFRYGYRNASTLESAILQALYSIDAQLADHEFATAIDK